MAQSAGFHEDADLLSHETRDRHRAITSVQEELEAVDWYDQRVDATTDDELRGILAHNRDEEKEHAAMLLEWLRRRDPALDIQLHQYLFTTTEIVDRGPSASGSAPSAVGSLAPDGSLGIGSLRGEEQ
ncbi:MAG: ferritin-like domain-containing protein [Acidimicrobiaceae bacterium]|nr:ferritin-like domain-containing protein [Acidimicrobiaceae bacterium]